MGPNPYAGAVSGAGIDTPPFTTICFSLETHRWAPECCYMIPRAMRFIRFLSVLLACACASHRPPASGFTLLSQSEADALAAARLKLEPAGSAYLLATVSPAFAGDHVLALMRETSGSDARERLVLRSVKEGGRGALQNESVISSETYSLLVATWDCVLTAPRSPSSVMPRRSTARRSTVVSLDGTTYEFIGAPRGKSPRAWAKNPRLSTHAGQLAEITRLLVSHVQAASVHGSDSLERAKNLANGLLRTLECK